MVLLNERCGEWRALAGSTVPCDAASYAEFAAKRNPNINVICVPSAQIEEKSFEKMTIWNSVIPLANTQKLHCVREHNSRQLHVSSVSGDNNVSLVGIFKDVVCDEEESVQEPVQDGPVLTRNLNINLGDWVLVCYDRQKFPGEVTNITGLDFEDNVMYKSCGAFWKWPPKEDKIFYQKENVIQKLDSPEVAGSRGQFKFKNL